MKDRFISKRYWVDAATPFAEIDKLARQFDDVISLSIGDPDIITPVSVIEKAFEDTRMGHTKYTQFRGDPELRDELAAFYMEEYGVEVADDEIFISAGACVGMHLVLEAILDDGDEVIVPSPYFTPYKLQIELSRGLMVELPTFEEELFQVDAGRLESMITARTKAIILNTPNNPTGNCQTRESLEKIARIAKAYDLLVVADDIYTAFSFMEPFIPVMSIGGMKERTITINSASKNFTMTGWRVGNIIAPPHVIKTITDINEGVVFTAPAMSQRAYIHALRLRREILPPVVEEYRRRMFYVWERVKEIPKLSVLEPMGTFYSFANIKAAGLSSTEVCRRIIDEAHVLTLPGVAFGTYGEGYIRLACTIGMDKMEEAFDRIEKVSILR